MLTRLAFGLGLMLGTSGPAFAQAPLSAIDWLSDSLAQPLPSITGPDGTDVTNNALPEDVTVTEIDGPRADAVGLLPVNVTGLPRDLWGPGLSQELAGRLQSVPADLYPAMHDLLMTLMLAELDPPSDAGTEATLFLARIDTLLSLGAVEEANAMLEISGAQQRGLFRRAFDVALLLHTENGPCQTLRNTPELSPTFPARIFCLARGGDWDAAALSLETGRALGYLSDFEDALLARFLEPEIAEGQPRVFVPPHPSPLVFRLLEAIGEPLPTAGLPSAYAHADLHSNTGWKAQLSAAERLVRTRGLPASRLEGLYFDRKAAASGGIWERVRAIQKLNDAIHKGDEIAISDGLVTAWQLIRQAELEVAFATMFAHRLGETHLTGPARHAANEIGLLADDYETVARRMQPTTERQALLQAIATGQTANVHASDDHSQAILDGFRAETVPVRLQSLMADGRLGEAILRSIALFQGGALGDLDELTDALAFWRMIGLEDTARRAALQFILLERRG